MSRLAGIQTSVLYEAVLPSTGQKVKFRPYNVAEERALLTAEQDGDPISMLWTLQRVISQCIQDEVERFTSIDIEYMFAQLRMKSVGEIAVIGLSCKNKECEHHEDKPIMMEYNLDNLEVYIPSGYDKPIKLSDELAIQLQFPSFDSELNVFRESEDPWDRSVRMIQESIKTIYYGDEVIDISEEDPQEVISFIERLETHQFERLIEVASDTPTIKGVIDFKCPKCKADNHIILSGLMSFFA